MDATINRNTYIDFLRFIGVSLIILAHVNAPSLIHQVRCFDVPLMVFISGLSYSGKILRGNLKDFFVPRLLRLTVPVYIFLTIYFFVALLIGKPQSEITIISSYCLLYQHSIGYVWIIKVFLLIMLVTPILLDVSRRLSLFQFCILLILFLLVQDFLCKEISDIQSKYINLLISEFIPYLVGYSIIFMVGLQSRYIGRRDERLFILVVLLLAIIVFVQHYFTGQSFNLQLFKYPPQSYFIIYGILASQLLWLLRNNKYIIAFSNFKFFSFVGRNTIWIYLWHILYVIIANLYIQCWASRYIIVYSLSVVTFIAQYKIVEVMKFRTNWRFLKFLIG